MEMELPKIREQKRLCFRPSRNFLHHTYEMLNYDVFENTLRKPQLMMEGNRKNYWGMCLGQVHRTSNGSYCQIEMMDKWFCVQWFVTTLAHEMVHQYQWDILGPEREKQGKDWLMSHGPTFFDFKDHMKSYNISLKTAHSQRKWFKHQNLFKA
jgi:hypothetical protein